MSYLGTLVPDHDKASAPPGAGEVGGIASADRNDSDDQAGVVGHVRPCDAAILNCEKGLSRHREIHLSILKRARPL